MTWIYGLHLTCLRAVNTSDQSNMRHTQRESLIIVGVIATALGGMFVSCMVLGMVC
jgi:hypothetical protein